MVENGCRVTDDFRELAALPEVDAVDVVLPSCHHARLVENDQTALDQGGYSLEQSDKNGYADIRDRDYITLPRGAGIVGIVRAGAGLQLLPPPFAVRFDAQGRLFVGDPWSSDPYVFYDANFNGRYQQDKTRDNAFPSSFNYVPAQWDPESSSYIASNDTSDSPGVHPDTGRHKLPFEVVETVVGEGLRLA